MKIELANCTNQLLWEIEAKWATRLSLSKTYALAILSSEKTDWKKVNQAIIKRWSRSGLDYIKRKAWRLIENDPNRRR